MRREHPAERGVALVAGALWLGAVVAMTAIAIEVARLTTTATEVQVAADAGAFAAAVALGRKKPPDDARAAGKSTAGANFVDGHAVGPDNVQIDVGHYDPAPAANPHFTAECTPGGTTDGCNAAKATVTAGGVNFVTASILNGQQGTAVTKTAVAAAECPGSGFAKLPMVVCESALQSIPQDELCNADQPPFQMNPNGTNSATDNKACWSSLSPDLSASADNFLSLFPAECGGTQQFELFAQQDVPLQNGADSRVWKAIQCCVACQNHKDFTVPVVDCSQAGNCNTSPPLVTFATIHIENPTDVVPPGNGNTQCNSFSWGCQATINNNGPTGITASQFCKSDVPGKPSTLGCTNQASTVIVLGQLP
jgi:hypothetical protein